MRIYPVRKELDEKAKPKPAMMLALSPKGDYFPSVLELICPAGASVQPYISRLER